MDHKINQIVEAWDKSSSEERELFLKELHKRYGFERLCLALSIVTNCELRNGNSYRYGKNGRSQVLSSAEPLG